MTADKMGANAYIIIIGGCSELTATLLSGASSATKSP